MKEININTQGKGFHLGEPDRQIKYLPTELIKAVRLPNTIDELPASLFLTCHSTEHSNNLQLINLENKRILFQLIKKIVEY